MSTLSEYPIPFSYKKIRVVFGMNNGSIMHLIPVESFTNDLYLEISDRKEADFRNAIKKQLKLLPGLISLLDSFRRENFPRQLLFCTPGKPDPNIFLTAARKLDILPGKCIVIEDATAGLEATRRAGIKCVAVTTTNPAVDLQSADLVVDRLDTITVVDLIALVE